MTSAWIPEVSAQPAHVQLGDARSPCVGICDVFEYCGRRFYGGCGRSVEEIKNWVGFDTEEKLKCKDFASRRMKIWYDES